PWRSAGTRTGTGSPPTHVPNALPCTTRRRWRRPCPASPRARSGSLRSGPSGPACAHPPSAWRPPGAGLPSRRRRGAAPTSSPAGHGPGGIVRNLGGGAMKVGFVRQRVMAAVLCGAVMAGAPSAPAEEPSPEQLRRELEAMKRQVQQLQEQIKKQETVINKLSAEHKAAAAAPQPAAPAKAETTPTDEERLKREV